MILPPPRDSDHIANDSLRLRVVLLHEARVGEAAASVGSNPFDEDAIGAATAATFELHFELPGPQEAVLEAAVCVEPSEVELVRGQAEGVGDTYTL